MKPAPVNAGVEFDDFKITHTKSNLIQASEYYPFGLQTANSWTRENNTGNNYLANGGTELNSTSNLYDLEFRNYDPALARMHQVDPMAGKYSSLTPYNYSFNSPTNHNDPNGADPSPGEPDYVKHRNLGVAQTFDINHGPTYGAGASLFDMIWAGGFGNIGGIKDGFEALHDYYEMSDAEYMDKYAEKVNSSHFGAYAAAANTAKDQYVLGIIRTLGNINYLNYQESLLDPGLSINRNSLIADLSRSPQDLGGNNIVYQRTTETDQSTTGTFTIPTTNIKGYILEPAGPSVTTPNLNRRIPAGTYNLILNKGEKYGLRLYNDQVPQSRGILIHIGNYPGDTKGCLLPGSSLGPNFVGGSGNVLNQIMNHFNQVGFNGATITILDPNHP